LIFYKMNQIFTPLKMESKFSEAKKGDIVLVEFPFTNLSQIIKTVNHPDLVQSFFCHFQKLFMLPVASVAVVKLYLFRYMCVPNLLKLP
jgi:hypothetical protein